VRSDEGDAAGMEKAVFLAMLDGYEI